MNHITQEKRYTISCMFKQGIKISLIAKEMQKDKTSIYREIKRNSDKRNQVYKADLAHKKYLTRHCKKNKFIRFSESIRKDVDNLIREDYSPEQVVGFLIKEGKEIVSIERIYQYIWSDKKSGGDLYSHLRRQGRTYRKRGNNKDTRGLIKGRVNISNRDNIVELRNRFGDLEVDLIIGKNHNQAILTINDRASGVLRMRKVKSKQACVVTKAIKELLEDWKPYLKTITADNGKEFAGHIEVAEYLEIDYFFANPYHSWERGSNENLNGLIRQYFKKGSDFTLISEQRIKEVETKLNNRPRKRYNYQTPIFVMVKLLFKPKVAFVA